jgi:hypothetical protein
MKINALFVLLMMLPVMANANVRDELAARASKLPTVVSSPTVKSKAFPDGTPMDAGHERLCCGAVHAVTLPVQRAL